VGLLGWQEYREIVDPVCGRTGGVEGRVGLANDRQLVVEGRYLCLVGRYFLGLETGTTL